MTAGAGLDRSRPPMAAASREFVLPQFTRGRLPNGIRYYLAPVRTTPLLQLDVVTPGGSWHNPPARPGLATLTATLLDEGTRSRSALQLARDIESIGGYLGSYAGWDSAEVSTTVLSKHLEMGLELVTDVLTHPSFPEHEIERLRGQRLAELQRRLSEPSSLAVSALRRVLFGDSVYGHSLLGTEASLAEMTRSDLVGYYERHVTVRDATILVVGNFDQDRTLDLLRSRFGALEWPEAPPGTRIPPAKQGSERRVVIVDRPEAAQTEIRMGHRGIARDQPELPAIQTLNTLLGGKFTSRLNLNLREKHGFTYGVHSSFAARSDAGPFVISTSVATDVAGQATRQVLVELDRLQQEPPAQEEVEDTVSYMRGVFPYTFQKIDDLSARLRILALHRLPDDYYATYLNQLTEVTPTTLLETARRFLHPSEITIVAVGPAEALSEQLEPLGSLSIHRPEEATSLL